MKNGRVMLTDDKDKPPTLAKDAQQVAQWRPLILVVLLLALVLRLTAAVVVERRVQQAGRTFFIEGDANGYWHLGMAIANGDDYSVHTPTRRILRVPGFPLLLAGTICLFGDSVFAARCVLAMVGVGCCWLTWLLGSRLVMPRVGFWAALLMALHPLQIGNSVLILSENWFTFWMLAGLLAFVKLVDDPRGMPDENAKLDREMLGRALFTGGLIAVAVLVRPGFIPWLIVAIAGVLFLLKQSWSARLTVVAVLLVAFATVMMPWVFRNHKVTGHWVLTSLWSGPSLYDGLNPEADGTSNMEFFDRENVMGTMSEYEMNAHYQHRAVEFMRTNPWTSVVLSGRKFTRFLQLAPSANSMGWAQRAVCGAWVSMFGLLCVVGIRSQLLNPTGLLVVLGPFLLFMAVHMVFVGSLRYRLPVEFPLAILAATGLRQWLPRK